MQEGPGDERRYGRGHRHDGRSAKKKRQMTHRKVKRGGPAGRQAGTIRRGGDTWNLEVSQVGRQAGRPEGCSAGRQAGRQAGS